MIKGFLFDKDGTLIDFKTIWLPISQDVTDVICEKYHMRAKKEILLKAIGVKGEMVDSNGVLASKTTEDVAAAWYKIIEAGIPFERFADEVKAEFLLKAHENIELVQLLPGVKETLHQLKLQGFSLGIATADTKEITEFMLRKLGVEELFEFVGTDDGITPAKPHPAHLQNFCKIAGLKNFEVAMVGDTLCDMEFGKNFGAYTIGVLSGTGEALKLEKYADLMIPSAAELLMRTEWRR